MKIVFFGTPTIAANILDELIQGGLDIVAVVTKADKPQGRSQKIQPSAVKELVTTKYPTIDLLQPDKVSTKEYEEILKKYSADLFIVVAYGEIIKQNILDIPKKGCINVHASLLPKYRGAAPIHRVIINGEVETGISIMEMVLALDAGPVLLDKKIDITPDMTTGELEKKLEGLAVKALFETLGDYENKFMQRKSQNHDLATYAPKITPQECQINWNRPSIELHNLIRGVNPFPGAWCDISFNDGNPPKRLKIKKSKVLDVESSKDPGSILEYSHNSWIVKTQDSALEICEVQLEGKKSSSSSEFISGYPKPKFL